MWLLHRYFPVFQLIEEPLAYAGVLPVFFGISMAAISAVRFVKAEFPDDDGGKPTVMRYIIRDQAGMAEYWEGK